MGEWVSEGVRVSAMVSLCPLQSFSHLVPANTAPLKLVHKKIKLSEDLLSWEHERFSLKRLPAATLSSLHHHLEPRRHSMFVNRCRGESKREGGGGGCEIAICMYAVYHYFINYFIFM